MALHRRTGRASGAAFCAALAIAALAIASAQPAQAFVCFGFSMGSDGPSFRFGFGEPGAFRVLQYGPPSYQPSSYVIPWNSPPYGPWAPPQQFMAPSPYAWGVPGGFGPGGYGPGSFGPGGYGFGPGGYGLGNFGPGGYGPGGFGPGGYAQPYAPSGYMPWSYPAQW